MKKLVCLMLAMLMLFSMIGCASPSAGSAAKEPAAQQPAAEKTEKAEAAPAAASTEPVELRFLDTNPSATRQGYYEGMFAKIEQELGIKVIYESVPMDEAANKITVMASSNALPDIITTQDNWLGGFTGAEYIIPLDSYIEPIKDQFADTVTKITWKAQEELYGSIYTVPDGMMVKGIFVRKDWAEAKGVELSYDWTYDDYFNVITALTDPSQNQYGMTYRGVRGAFDPIMVYMQSLTGGRTYDEQGNCLFRSKECLDAFIKYTNTYVNGEAPKDAINWGFVEMCDNFIGGLTGTLNNDSEVAAMCLEGMQDGTWTVLPIPHSTADGKIYNTVNAPYSYTISSNCENTDAAWQVINFLVQPANNIEYCKLVGEIPIMKAVGDDPFFGADGVYGTFVKELSDTNLVVPTGYGAGDFTELQQGPLFEEIQSYLLGQQTAEAALTNICDMLEGVMKEYLADNPGATIETPKTMQ